MKKMLIAIDGSSNAMKAVEYVGRQFSGINDLFLTILHVLPYPPAPLWDDGHIPTEEESEIRAKYLERWLKNEKAKLGPVFDKAVQILTGENIRPGNIVTKSISDSIDVAGSILEEARDGGYDTLVLGRRGLSPARHFLMGSVTSKIINHGAGIAICVVE
ncbi:MAG: universal stress protein [Candidatus Sulfobium sp.]|jgi:nucleotide-binding universal stress UspA family protein